MQLGVSCQSFAVRGIVGVHVNLPVTVQPSIKDADLMVQDNFILIESCTLICPHWFELSSLLLCCSLCMLIVILYIGVVRNHRSR